MDEKINPARKSELVSRTGIRFWLSGRRGLFFIVLTLIVILLSYIAATSDPIAAALWEYEIDRAERRWNRAHISSYTIQVQEWSWWHLQSYTIVVRNGKVTSSSSACGQAPGGYTPCDVHNFDPNDFTVPGLFAATREWGMKDMVTFHRRFGFPWTIAYDAPGVFDDNRGLKVLTFQPENP